MIKKLLHSLVALVVAVMAAGCSDDLDDARFVFIGDSIIARWDLQQSFPVLETRNMGLGGSGITYLHDHCGQLQGKTAVVISGTNDLAWLATASVEAYAAEYVDAVLALGATDTYVISILPRDFATDTPLLRETLDRTNAAIKARCEVADAPGLHYVDVFALFAGDGGMPKLNYFYDGLHPNLEGYEVLTGQLNKYLL